MRCDVMRCDVMRCDVMRCDVINLNKRRRGDGDDEKMLGNGKNMRERAREGRAMDRMRE